MASAASVVLAFSVNIPPGSGPSTLIVLNVPSELQGQVLQLTEVSFISIENQALGVEIQAQTEPSPPEEQVGLSAHTDR